MRYYTARSVHMNHAKLMFGDGLYDEDECIGHVKLDPISLAVVIDALNEHERPKYVSWRELKPGQKFRFAPDSRRILYKDGVITCVESPKGDNIWLTPGGDRVRNFKPGDQVEILDD